MRMTPVTSSFTKSLEYAFTIWLQSLLKYLEGSGVIVEELLVQSSPRYRLYDPAMASI